MRKAHTIMIPLLLTHFLCYVFLLTGCKQIDCKVNNYVPNSYSVFLLTYSLDNFENKFSIDCVQVTDMSDRELENTVNETLQRASTEWITEYLSWMSMSKVSILHQDESYLSICYSFALGDSEMQEFDGNQVRVFITIDMKSGKRVLLDNLLSQEEFNNYLAEFTYDNEFAPPLSSDEMTCIFAAASMTEKEYLDMIQQSDPYIYYPMEYILFKPSFYLAENQLVIKRNNYSWSDIELQWSCNQDVSAASGDNEDVTDDDVASASTQ